MFPLLSSLSRTLSAWGSNVRGAGDDGEVRAAGYPCWDRGSVVGIPAGPLPRPRGPRRTPIRATAPVPFRIRLDDDGGREIELVG